jgi:hypothetical protein
MIADHDDKRDFCKRRLVNFERAGLGGTVSIAMIPLTRSILDVPATIALPEPVDVNARKSPVAAPWLLIDLGLGCRSGPSRGRPVASARATGRCSGGSGARNSVITAYS